MCHYKFICIILFLAVHYSNNLCAQKKFEKESRIKQKDVPFKALQFINSLELNKKVKWYQEEGFKTKSIEAKFKLNKIKYSLEFDTLGIIEDLEIEANWKGLDARLLDSIFLIIKKDCLKHKIVKLQIQYSGDESAIFTKIKTLVNNVNLTIKYELIITCKIKKNVDLYEYLFSETGKLLSISKIVFRNSSHLEY